MEPKAVAFPAPWEYFTIRDDSKGGKIIHIEIVAKDAAGNSAPVCSVDFQGEEQALANAALIAAAPDLRRQRDELADALEECYRLILSVNEAHAPGAWVPGFGNALTIRLRAEATLRKAGRLAEKAV